MDKPNKIEREVDIAAPVERVWQLVTEPGWWIGDGERSGQSRHREGDLEIVEDPKYGRFPVRVESIQPKRYVSYRWAAGSPGQAPADGNSTLVEFWLTEHGDGTLLRVAESGFDSLAVSAEEREQAYNGNVKGWIEQLDIVKADAETART